MSEFKAMVIKNKQYHEKYSESISKETVFKIFFPFHFTCYVRDNQNVCCERRQHEREECKVDIVQPYLFNNCNGHVFFHGISLHLSVQDYIIE